MNNISIKTMISGHIRVKAICVFRRGEDILVCEYYDTVKKQPFYRPLGGAVEFGETTREAIGREIREETGWEVTDLKLLDTIESLFVHEGKPGHEIIFAYEGRFTDKTPYEQESFEINEDNEFIFKASWRKLKFFNDEHLLVPEALKALLKTNR